MKTIQGYANGLLALSPNFVVAIIVFTGFYFAAKLVRSAVRRLSAGRAHGQNLGLVMGRIAQLAILAVGFFIAIVIVVPSIKASSIIQLFGISSVAIGFAFKDVLQNFLSGILILLNQPFRLRDQIRVGEFEGTVEEIQTRATLIRTYDGRRIVIPNSKVFTESVTVNTAYPSRRNEVVVGIGYSDDVAKARGIILEAIASCEGVEKDPAPDAIVTELAASSVNIRARWWSRSGMADFLKAQDLVIAAIRSRLTEAGIDLPFPTRQILFHDQTEEADGDRRRQREGWPAGSTGPVAMKSARAEAGSAPEGRA